MKRKVIWFLFDSEHSTGLEFSGQYEVYCFGIGSGSRHIPLDLSDFERARAELDKYPKPDYIFASPPCETWCFVSVGSKRHFTSEPGINLYWREKWVPFDFLPKHVRLRKNGENTAFATSKIIKHYRPEFWAIENGTRSLLFSWLSDLANLLGYKNLSNYYSYGFEYLKPTTIYSNIPLSLKRNSPSSELAKIETHVKGKTKSELASIRSRVPAGLYSDILSQFSAPCVFPWGLIPSSSGDFYP